MKNIYSRIPSFLLIVSMVGISLFIINYYWSFWQSVTAQNVAESVIELPEGHPDITNEMQLKFPAEGKYCLSCHQGIEPTRPLHSGMMRQILDMGAEMGDPNGCVVCHGGNPSEIHAKHLAHRGAPKGSKLPGFTPVPGALQVNEHTCGLCHSDHTYNVHRSIMNTDAGKMKAIMWCFGMDTNTKDHVYGNHAIDDPDGSEPRFGSEQYKEYMREIAKQFPGQFPTSLKAVPQTAHDKLKDLPEEAAFAYLRNCNACHTSGKGMQDRGHFRGMGCASCHSLYANEGFYEGGDPSINKEKPGHVMVHSMQGSRKSTIVLNGKKISGVQVSTCASCHAAGRRIGHAYQGLMALGHSDNRGPFDENAMPQMKNAGYVFKYIRNDAHHRISKDGKTVTGLLCQDCHTTNAMHGNGNIGSTTLATVEIECADCHGTPTHYPWELPLGYGDEFGRKLDMKKSRGLADEPLEVTRKFGMVYPKEDGYVLSSRGNALGNVVRRGDKVIVHSDAGHDFEVPVLKSLTENRQWKNAAKAEVAMVNIHRHMESLECYACHSTWAPQYYGYKSVLDFSKKTIDWIGSSGDVDKEHLTADYRKEYVMQNGAEVMGDYSHVRWENPPLGINGEGRVSPLTGVIQMISTVIDKDGKVVTWNRTPRTKDGKNAMELAPLQPHTASLESRDCADCHGNSAAAGYGLDNGAYDADPHITRYADVVDNDGLNVSKHTKAQIHAIKDLYGDFIQILDSTDRQLLTVDSHWPTSMPLTREQRDVLARGNTCLACHQDIPNGAIPIRMLGKVAEVAHLSFAPEAAHDQLLRENNVLISWVKALGLVALVLMIPVLIILFWKRREIVKFIKKLKGNLEQ